jgi:uncharacterized protein YbjT (DUF2867 family)
VKQALIIGSTGLVGSYLLELLLADKNYSKVVTLVRQKTKSSSSKEIQHLVDFTNLQSAVDYFKNIDELYICIGTTKNKTPDKNAYFAIDFGIPTEAAEIALWCGVKKIAVISAMGANANSRIFYNATKGKMEEHLKGLGIPNLVIVRPSLIVGPRKEKRMGEGLAKFVINGLSFLIPAKFKAIHAKTIASAMHLLLQNSSTQTIWENDELQALPI